jgi:hypothetical protein
MKCEEFEIIGLERTGRLLTGLDATQSAAAEHVSTCPRCAALQESWQEARAALQDLRQVTDVGEAPQRVEMRLRQEFAMRHRTMKARSTAIFAAWTLATAALLFAGVSWWNWRVSQNQRASLTTETTLGAKTADRVPQTNDGAPADPTLVADNDAGDFTLLPGNLPQEVDDAAIVRVRMQRGALGALGLPVNEERVSDWIQVDLLVGPDGQPKAVRLPE